MKEENEIEKLCLDIYKKHKTALELIFKYRPDTDIEVSKGMITYLESCQDIIYEGFNYGKNILRFTTQTMTELFPNATPNPNSPWNNGYAFMYEMNLLTGKIAAVFAHPIYNTTQQQNDFEQKMQLVLNYTQRHNLELGIIKKQKLSDNWKFHTALNKVIIEREKFNGTTEELINEFRDQLTLFIEDGLRKFENEIKLLITTPTNAKGTETK